MDRMAQWAVIIPADTWATERLFHHDTVTVPGGAGAIAPDDDVLLVADGGVVALARATKPDGDAVVASGDAKAGGDLAAPTTDAGGGDLVLTYLRRAFDAPVPVGELDLSAGVAAVEPAVFARLASGLGASPGGRRTWLASVALPIEADTPAEAVRQFWSHVLELGPGELPTYVWPSGDELAMQAFVLGEEANQDPEEDDDEEDTANED
jgi:hypothetical protein